MSKSLGDRLFAFAALAAPQPAYERYSAADVGRSEAWLRDAIHESPELVIGPCRSAGLCDDEEWYPWQKEYSVPSGSIDVLLLSSSGRVGVVETKLATNREIRRRVLAQVLDYVTSLPEGLREKMPPIPTDAGGQPLADRDQILASVDEGDVLLIVASDDIDPNVARLSQGLLGGHLVKRWDLALIDLALFRPTAGGASHLIVPTAVATMVREVRQVVRVVVEGETPRAKISVEHVTPDETTSGGERWNEERFFERIESEVGPSPVRDLAMGLRALARATPSLVLVWGRGRKDGSMTVKRRDGGLIEVYSNGWLGFRPNKFTRALGAEVGGTYQAALEKIFPRAMSMDYPMVPPAEAQSAAPRVLEAITQAVHDAERSDVVSGVG